MRLTLHDHDAPQRPAGAAFLRGIDVGAWLREIGRWEVGPAALACYLVPESLHTVAPAGLLVVAKNGPLPALADAWEPYGVEAGKLYLPLHATLHPATDPIELAATLLWPRQLFHPTIGLVGFAATDEVPLADLLAVAPARPADWTGARSGPPARPPLTSIRVLPPTVADVLAAFGQHVGTEPLTNLPKPENEAGSPAQALLDRLSQGALKTALSATQSLRELLAAAQAGPGGGSGPAGPGGPGLLDRLENWLGHNLDDLEKKRRAEIERLLALFGEDPAEALRYAIPLGGPYFNRGTAPPSAQLGPRSSTFDLNKLGGGGRVDAWNLDDFQHQLRTQYQAAAQHEADAGRAKKAAYIYAHLLGDYLAAARVLEQGRYYREAAVLYRDHLRNLPAAAECLERGGLLLEAVELYAQLSQHEKAGDLYQRLAQPDAAARHYEQTVAQALHAGDYPEAARVQHTKLTQPEQARHTLLEGWTNSAQQPEACLKRYFELIAETTPDALGAQITAVFRHRTPPTRRAPLLHVLIALAEQPTAPADPAALPAAREAAYEILSAEAAAGNLALLPTLKKFLPDDRLVAADLSRFAAARRVRPPRPAAADAWQLDERVYWQQAVTHRNQFLALGRRDGQLHLARANWYGSVEYYSWPHQLSPESWVELVADAAHSTRLFLRHAENVAFETKLLPKNKYFDQALTVEAPAWLPNWPAGLALLPDGDFATMTIDAGQMTLRHYKAAGQLVRPLALHWPDNEPSTPFEPSSGRKLIYRNGSYYSFNGYERLIMEETGFSESYYLGEDIQQLVASAYSAELVLAFGLPQGGVVWRADRDGTEQTTAFEVTALVTDLQFVSADHLVIAGAREAAVFHLADEAGVPSHTVRTLADIVAVLPTADRHRFALLEATGRVSLHPTQPE